MCETFLSGNQINFGFNVVNKLGTESIVNLCCNNINRVMIQSNAGGI